MFLFILRNIQIIFAKIKKKREIATFNYLILFARVF